MGAIVEFLKIVMGIVVWLVTVIVIIWFLEGFWKGLSELVGDFLGTSKK
ncbi:hypothetical protein [Thermococcus alcaliphilus]|nr:hypothetical protein [Thermococcus alcaliphilus]MCO6041420.1 hypothetical protein [Thermococcus alcaliphilus]